MQTQANIIKTFTIGFIPLLIFIIADELFGTRIGLITAVIVGIGEFMYYFLKYRQIEKFVLYDTLLIIALGSVSILLENEIFFKLKPALIEFILLILLGVHSFSQKPLLLLMGARYLKEMQISDAQKEQMRKMTRILFFVVAIHIVLVVYSAYFMSKEAWAFISGGLFYIIFGLVFVVQWFSAKYKQRRPAEFKAQPGEEWFDLVDTEGNVTGKAPRSAVHGNPALLHPVVHLHVFNKKGQLFLQKRSASKEIQPGKWDTSVGGHVASGEPVESALVREALEELSLTLSTFSPLYRYVMRSEIESELVYTFRTVANGPFKYNRQEIELGRFWTLKEIENNLGKNIFTPNFEQEFKLLKQTLNQKIKRK